MKFVSSRWIGLSAVLLILVLSVAPLVWFEYSWILTQDAGDYLLVGWHLVSGQGYTLIDGTPFIKRGPVLTGLLGVLTLFFGRDTEDLAWTVRLLALLNPLLAYFLVKRLSSPVAGLVAAALVTLLSYTAINQQALNIDALLLTVYLLTLLLLLAAIRRDSSLLALFSGLALGVSILTKETSFANLPLALLAVLLFGWGLRRALWHYLGVALVCLPWWAWVYLASGQIYMMGRLSDGLRSAAAVSALILLVLAAGLYASGVLDRFLAGERRRRWAGWSLVIAWTVALTFLLLKAGGPGFGPKLTGAPLGALRTYAAVHLAPNIAVWPLLPVAAGYVVYKAVRGPISWRLFAVVLLFQLPIILLATIQGWNQRQFLTPQTLLLCALAVLITEVCVSVAREAREKRFPDWIKLLAAVLLVTYPLVSAGVEVRNLLTGHAAEPSGGGAATVQANKMSDWMVGNVPEGEEVVTTPLQSNYMAFADGGNHEWRLLGADRHQTKRPAASKGGTAGYGAPSGTLWIQVNRNCEVLSYSTPNIMNQTRQRNVKFLMMTDFPIFPGLLGSASGLADSGAFEVVHRNGNVADNEGFVLLRSTGRPPDAVPTWMSVTTLLFMKRCEYKKGPGYAARIRSRFPNGVVLVPNSKLGRVRGTPAASRYARARKALEQIYRSPADAP